MIKLETLLSLQDETINRLNEELFRQQQDITKLQRRLEALEQKVGELDSPEQIAASELDHLPTVSGDVGPPPTAPETIEVINSAQKEAREEVYRPLSARSLCTRRKRRTGPMPPDGRLLGFARSALLGWGAS